MEKKVVSKLDIQQVSEVIKYIYERLQKLYGLNLATNSIKAMNSKRHIDAGQDSDLRSYNVYYNYNQASFINFQGVLYICAYGVPEIIGHAEDLDIINSFVKHIVALPIARMEEINNQTLKERVTWTINQFMKKKTPINFILEGRGDGLNMKAEYGLKYFNSEKSEVLLDIYLSIAENELDKISKKAHLSKII